MSVHSPERTERKRARSGGTRRCRVLRTVAAVLCVLLGTAFVSRSIPLRTGSAAISSAAVGSPAIALTFDDGPGEATQTLLDGLAKYGAKATFFVLGVHAKKYPDTVRRIVRDGHLLGSHSYSHLNFLTHTTGTIRADLERNESVLREITGETPSFSRAPHGYITALQLKTLGRVFVKWSYDTYDWKLSDASEVYARVMKAASDGEIILLHDTRSSTVEGVLRAVEELTKQGFSFVRVDELLSRNGEAVYKGIPYRYCKQGHRAVAY